jgi:hypothetical protein
MQVFPCRIRCLFSAILFLLPTLSLSDCSPLMYTNGEVHLTGLTFDGCVSEFGAGGAITVMSESLETETIIDHCVFLNCDAGPTGPGGALALGAADTLVIRCFFGNCRSGATGSSAIINSQAGTYVTCSETTSTGGFAGYEATWCLITGLPTITARFDHGNITGCETTEFACGVFFSEVPNVVLEFCEIVENSGTNCIDVSGQGPSSIRCLALISNLCTGEADVIGLFYAEAAMTVRDSLFRDNNCDYFVHATDTLTFAQCHFDSFALDTTGEAVVTADCLANAGEVSWVAQCLATGSASPLPTETLPATAHFTLNIGARLSSRRNLILRFAYSFALLLV